MKLIKNKSYSFPALFELVKNKLDRDFDINEKEKYIRENIYDIYVAKDEKLNENTTLYVGEPVEIDDDDNEVYPQEVVENNLEFYYSCQNFQDVIDLAYTQKSNVSIDEIIQCLNCYTENDTFLDLV